MPLRWASLLCAYPHAAENFWGNPLKHSFWCSPALWSLMAARTPPPHRTGGHSLWHSQLRELPLEQFLRQLCQTFPSDERLPPSHHPHTLSTSSLLQVPQSSLIFSFVLCLPARPHLCSLLSLSRLFHRQDSCSSGSSLTWLYPPISLRNLGQ